MNQPIGEDGNPTIAVEFDYAAIDGEYSSRDLDGMRLAMRKLFAWVWQGGMADDRGRQIRNAIVCWIFLEELRPLTMSQFARGLGLHKQSLGRWIDDFKRQFPEIRTPHMR